MLKKPSENSQCRATAGDFQAAFLFAAPQLLQDATMSQISISRQIFQQIIP